jgi:Cu2+-exporting ATPase
MVGDGPAFCCPGCQGVYYALSEAGLDGFYRLRELDADDVPPRPAAATESADRLVLDRPEFLERHSQLLDDGSRKAQFVLDGVHCAGCVWLVERMPRYVDGAIDARLELGRGRLELRWDPERVALSKMVEWLSRFGYVAHPINDHDQGARSTAERKLLATMGASWAIAANVMLLALPHYAGLELADDPVLAHGARWLSLILATAALAVGGRIFFRRAMLSLRGALEAGGKAWLRLSMDVPISFGVLAAYAASAYATVTGDGQIWFDSVTMLIAGLVTARWLQLRASQKATEATSRLLSLIPRSARRITGDGIEEVGIEELCAGERVEVRAGDVVPVDGRVVDGKSSLYRAVLTGESRPEAIGPGEDVHAGETNLEGVLCVEVDAVGDQTQVGKLLSWVQSHNAERAPVVQLADRIGGMFVLATIFFAGLTGVLWEAFGGGAQLEPIVAVLVVACPCALGMATPLALAVGVGKAARQGLFIKHEDVLENVDKLGWMVLDKTGTLTEGKLSVVETVGSTDAVGLAACLEAKSTHPIASAIVAAGAEAGAPVPFEDRTVEEVTETAGCGVSGTVDGHHVQVGRPGWIETLLEGAHVEEDTHAKLAQQVDKMAVRGQTPVAIAVDGRLAAVVALGDRIRPEAPAFIARLRQMGIEPMMLSGDHPKVCEKFAQEVGVGEKFARGGLSPEEKREAIALLRQNQPQHSSNRAVAMVGDGVNDAAALQAADIGICVAGSTDVALAAADVFSTRNGLAPVAKLLEGAKGVMGTVRRNLVVSLGYNALAVTLAAAGLIGPLAAAILMPLSSLAVVTLSLSQSSFEPDRLAENPGLRPGPLRPMAQQPTQLTRKPTS